LIASYAGTSPTRTTHEFYPRHIPSKGSMSLRRRIRQIRKTYSQ
jgi:hypothetical protein